jgi:pimeloyl-ACP methyl ester carboxylesterase
MDPAQQLSRSAEIAARVTRRLEQRLQVAQANYSGRLQAASAITLAAGRSAAAGSLWDLWSDSWRYALDWSQRSVLFWDTLRQRGDNYLAHEQAGTPPVLHFEYATVLDARRFPRPVNYALLRIVPPAGVTVDDQRRPYIIIDPRAGHGPGIGGFKADSEVGVALAAGHPVYFVTFFPQPEPGQTLPDVTEAERQFVHKVRELHPASPKPALVGNCQGGWAAMMLAAADPGEVGPVVINGAPMSYWSGASMDGQAENPMRYAGGNLGGTWLASLASDLGNGVFDGAHLVQNFEGLNPANTFWDKYYNLFASVDTEAPRFLEFERWWGGFFLMNREEIEWITRNLFVGNDLWSGSVHSAAGTVFDPRTIRSPIILFASMGDNITPAQQAFNWVADVYGSTDEIKARGQVIVGLLHQSVGHLGIFVSGGVARKEHAQIVSVLQSIEALPPGLYGMEINERTAAGGEPAWDVQFVERTLEDVVARTNRPGRIDEKPFEAVETLSEFNQRAYELFAQPLVQSLANEYTAKLSRDLHPLRVQRWAWSSLNPWLGWLDAAAPWVRAQRQVVSDDAPLRRIEAAMADTVSAMLDYQREVRDALSEAQFFQVYGNLFALYLADRRAAERERAEADPRALQFVAEAIAAVDKGGYPQALARLAVLLARRGEPLPLAELELRAELLRDYRDLLPELPADEWRRIRGEQEVIVRYASDRALAALPLLLADAGDRERFLNAMERLLGDRRVQRFAPTADQVTAVARIRELLQAPPAVRPRPSIVRTG